MPARYAALLRQHDTANKPVYRLRAGAKGSGKVLAAWPAETHSLEQAIAAAKAFGNEHGLEVVIRRSSLERRILRWMLDALVVTPDGVGEIVDYDIEEDLFGPARRRDRATPLRLGRATQRADRAAAMTPAATIPTFPRFDQIPAELRQRWLTRNQLAEQGLRPARGAQMVARVRWRTGWAALYDKEQAVPKRQATEAQRTALRAAQERLAVQRRTCPSCGTLFPFILPTDDGWTCPECLRQQRQEDRAAAIERAARALATPEAMILDTETTGLDGFLVEIAVVSMAGEVLFNTRVDPQCPIEPEAAKIHGITEVGLAGAPTFAQIADGLTALLAGRTVWIYNRDFDASVLEREIARLALAKAQAGLLAEDLAAARRFADRCGQRWRRQMRWRCAMRLYSEFVGDWSPYHGSYRYQPLPGGDHSAAGDALATLAVLRRMATTEERA